MPAFLGGLPGAALVCITARARKIAIKLKVCLFLPDRLCRWRHDRTAGIPVPFRAPVLYVIHALLTGLGFTVMLCSASPSVIPTAISSTSWCSYFAWSVNQVVHGASGGGNLVVVYYVIFRFAITRFNLKTPGAIAKLPAQSKKPLPVRRVNRLQRSGNPRSLRRCRQYCQPDNCITRLRLSVKDMSLVNVRH